MGHARRVLVTGAAGFVGRHALDALAASGGDALLGIGRGPAPPLPAGAEFLAVDLLDRGALDACLAKFRPSHVLHLAAQASAGQAAGAETWRTNVAGLLNLAEAMLTRTPGASLIFASSSEVYGRAFLAGTPVSEEVSLQPVGVYARTKRAGEELLQDVLGGSAVKVLILRPFNHIGPGQDERFVVSSFAHQIARIEAGSVPPRLSVGNLEARREFLDVRDVALAYVRVIETSQSLSSGTILNVAGGVPRSIASVLDDLKQRALVSFEVVVDPGRLRPSDIAVATGDAARLRAATGWAPRISWESTLHDIIVHARAGATAPSSQTL